MQKNESQSVKERFFELHIEAWRALGLLSLACFVLLFGLFSVISPSQAADPPSIITYQGKLLENGISVSSTVGMEFVIYDSSVGGTAVYSASGTLPAPGSVSVSVESGIFSIDLGLSPITNEIDPDIFNTDELWLQITIDGTTLTPRKRINAVPFAINAARLSGNFATSTPTNTAYIPVASADGSFVFNTTTVSELLASTLDVSSTASFLNGNASIRTLAGIYDTFSIGSTTSGDRSGVLAISSNTTTPGSLVLYHGTDASVAEPDIFLGINQAGLGSILDLGGGGAQNWGSLRLADGSDTTRFLISASSTVTSFFAYDFLFQSDLTVSATATIQDLVTTGGITLGGVRRTSWPTSSPGLFTDGGGYLYPTLVSDKLSIGTSSAPTSSADLQVAGGATFLNGGAYFSTTTFGPLTFDAFRIGSSVPGKRGGSMIVYGNSTSPFSFALSRGDDPTDTSVSFFLDGNTARAQLGSAAENTNGKLNLFSATGTRRIVFDGDESTSTYSYVMGNTFFGTAGTESISTSTFELNGDDAYFHDLVGIGDSLYVENEIHIGTSSLHLSGDVSGGAIRMTGGPLSITSAGTLRLDSAGSTTLSAQVNTWEKLFSIENNGTVQYSFGGNTNFGIGTESAGASLDVVTPSSTDTAEVNAKFSIDDSSVQRLEIRNGTSTDAAYIPEIYGHAFTNTALSFQANTNNDTASWVQPMMRFHATFANGTTISNRPNMFRFDNGTSTLLNISQTGTSTFYGDIIGTQNLFVGATSPTDFRPVSGDLVFDGDDAYFEDLVAINDELFVQNSITIGTSSLELSGDSDQGIIELTNGYLSLRADEYVEFLSNGTSTFEIRDTYSLSYQNLLVAGTDSSYVLYANQDSDVLGVGFGPATNNDGIFQVQMTSSTGAESISRFSLADGSGYLSFENDIAQDGLFVPKIVGRSEGEDYSGLILQAERADDFGGLQEAAMIFRVTLNDGVSPQGGAFNPNYFEFQNGTSSLALLTVNPNNNGASLSINGAPALYNFAVSGTANITGDTTIGGDVTVGGAVTYAGTTTFSGFADFSGNIVDPVPVGNIPSGDTTVGYTGVAIQGDTLYAARATQSAINTTQRNENRLQVYNVADKSNLVQVASVGEAAPYTGAGSGMDLSPPPLDMIPYGPYLITITQASAGGLLITDVSDPGSIDVDSTVFKSEDVGLSSSVDIHIEGHYLYVVSTGADSVVIYDLSDISNVESVATIDYSAAGAAFDGPWSIDVKGRYAYVVTQGGALDIIDISDPENPVRKGNIQDGDGGALLTLPLRVDVVGNYAYVAAYSDDAMTIVDISDPDDPTYVGSVTSEADLDNIIDVEKVGNYVITANNNTNANADIAIIDVSDPTSPSVVNTIDADANNLIQMAINIRVEGNYLYVVSQGGAGTQGGVQVYDIGSVGIAAAEIGSARFGSLSVEDNANFYKKASFASGLEIGASGFLTYGDATFLASPATTTDQTSPDIQLNFSHTALFNSNVTTSESEAFVFNTNNVLNNTSELFKVNEGGVKQFAISASNTAYFNVADGRLLLGEEGNEGSLLGTQDRTLLSLAYDGQDTLIETYSGDMTQGLLMHGGNGDAGVVFNISGDYGTEAGLLANTFYIFNDAELTGPGTERTIIRTGATESFDMNTTSIAILDDNIFFNLAGGTYFGTTGTESIANGLFSPDGNDVYIEDQLGVNGDIYTDGTMYFNNNNASISENLGAFIFQGTQAAIVSSTNGTAALYGNSTVDLRVSPDFGDVARLVLVSSGGSQARALFMDNTMVLIGATTTGSTPNEELDIEGQIQFNIQTTGDTTIGVCKNQSDGTSNDVEFVECNGAASDIAEYYETKSIVEPGDIVMTTGEVFTYEEKLNDALTGLPMYRADATPINEFGDYAEEDRLTKESRIAVLDRASKDGAHSVVGIVSTNPYQALGRKAIQYANNPQPIAIAGRVPTKVTTENGSIAVGDTIAISSEPGVGMKAPSGARTVGIALESYGGEGIGKIMVAVMQGQHGVLDQLTALESQINEVYGVLSNSNPEVLSIDEIDNSSSLLSLGGNSILGVRSIIGFDGKWRISSSGDIISTVRTSQGDKDLYALKSEKSEIVLSGSSELVDGIAEIQFDNPYMEIIDGAEPMKISVTLTDEANGVYVTEKSVIGFTVRELAGGTSNATFDWVAIVYRRSDIDEEDLPEELLEEEVIEEEQDEPEENTDDTTDTEVPTSTPEIDVPTSTEPLVEEETPTTTPEVVDDTGEEDVTPEDETPVEETEAPPTDPEPSTDPVGEEDTPPTVDTPDPPVETSTTTAT